jgi:hypothetical protein
VRGTSTRGVLVDPDAASTRAGSMIGVRPVARFHRPALPAPRAIRSIAVLASHLEVRSHARSGTNAGLVGRSLHMQLLATLLPFYVIRLG